MPEIALTVVVVDRGLVAGWVSPALAGAVLDAYRDRIAGLRSEAARGGRADPFPSEVPVPPDWQADYGLEPGEIYCYGPDPPGDEGRPEFAAVRGREGGLGVGWYMTVTPAGDAVACPQEISDRVLVGGPVGSRPHEFPYRDAFAGWPDPVPLGNVGALAPIPEDVRARLGLKFTVSDGYSFSEDYTGPFWQPAGAK